MTYYRSLHRMFINENSYGKDMECIIPYEMDYDFTEVEQLNLQQFISVWNEVNIV